MGNEANKVISAVDEILLFQIYSDSTVVIQVSGTFVGTLNSEISVDGSSWYSCMAWPFNTEVSQTTITASGIFSASTAGASWFRLRASAWTSGSAIIHLRSTEGVSKIHSLSGSSEVSVTSGVVVFNQPLNIRPGAPVATDYLPVRLTDATSFYVAGGGEASVTAGVIVFNQPLSMTQTDVSAHGLVSVAGTVAISGPVSIGGTTIVSGQVSVGGTPTVFVSNQPDVSAHGVVSVGGTANVSGQVSVGGTVATNLVSSIQQDVSAHAFITNQHDVSAHGVMSVGGSVRIERDASAIVGLNFLRINTSAAGSNILVASSVAAIRVLGYSLAYAGTSSPSGAIPVTASFRRNTTALFGPVKLAGTGAGLANAVTDPFIIQYAGSMEAPAFQTLAGNQLNLDVSHATAITGHLVYVFI